MKTLSIFKRASMYYIAASASKWNMCVIRWKTQILPSLKCMPLPLFTMAPDYLITSRNSLFTGINWQTQGQRGNSGEMNGILLPRRKTDQDFWGSNKTTPYTIWSCTSWGSLSKHTSWSTAHVSPRINHATRFCTHHFVHVSMNIQTLHEKRAFMPLSQNRVIYYILPLCWWPFCILIIIKMYIFPVNCNSWWHHKYQHC